MTVEPVGNNAQDAIGSGPNPAHYVKKIVVDPTYVSELSCAQA